MRLPKSSSVHMLERRLKQMIKKLKNGKYRLYSLKKSPKTGERRNLGTFDTKDEAKAQEKRVSYFKSLDK